MSTSGGRKPNILVIQDDALLNNLLIERLALEGVNVVTCQDGKEGFALMRKLHPNLVVLGLILPSLSGIEVLVKMRRDATLKRIPVLILSYLRRNENIQQTKSFGVCDYLVKSDYTLDEIVEAILRNIDCIPRKHLAPFHQ